MSVLVCGAFDIGHWGHTTLLANAMKFGPVTVGLSTDDFLERSKRPPLFTFKERKTALESLGAKVHPRDSIDATGIARTIGPQFFACGNDHIGTSHLEDMGFTSDFLCDQKIVVVYFPYTREVSTSQIIERARGLV